MPEALHPAFLFALGVLACYRVSRFVPKGEEGPFRIFSLIRAWATSNQKRLFARGLLCSYCTSFWVALVLTFFMPYSGPAEFVLFWLAIAGGASLIFDRTG